MAISRLLGVAGLLFVAGLLPACSNNSDDGGFVRDDEISLELAGAFEVPPVDTAATGSGTLTINRDTNQISGSVTVTGLSSEFTGAHIHTGFAGVNGPVLIPLTQNATDPNQLQIPSSTLTEEEMALLLSGGMYVNVHSVNFPDGEIRGQIAPDGVAVVRTALSGDFEVPPVESAGSAIGYLTVDTNTGDLVTTVHVTDLPTANAAHIHQAFAGQVGEVIVPLTQNATTPEQWEAEATLTADQVAALLAGELYFNVHTPANPDGEIRGQIAPAGVAVVRTALSGDFEVPPVTTAGSGIAYATVDTESGGVVANIRVSDVLDANAAHIHQAFAGLAGGVIVPLAQNATMPELWEASATLSADQLAGFNRGELYFNVHTPTNPEGEIRGQIVPRGIVVVRTLLDGSQEVPPVTTSATGIGYSTVNSLSGEVTANIRTSGIVNETAAHIHQAPAGENGDVIVPLARPDAAEAPELWTATATFTAEQLAAYLADQTYFNVHTAAYPDGEIRGQIIVPESVQFIAPEPSLPDSEESPPISY